MFRDFKFLRRNSTKNEEIENAPTNPRDLPPNLGVTDSGRPPLNAIQEPKPEHEMGGYRGKADKTPTKHKIGTPEKNVSGLYKNRFGWNQGGEIGGGGVASATPRSMRTLQKTSATASSSMYSESNSTQSTPCKSVSKPPMSGGVRSKVEGNGGGRAGGFSALYRGGSIMSSGPVTVVNSEKVPHFDLKEDPSFWMDHNVQVIIRVRPLNNMEKSINGYSRCLKQESAHTITWIGQPETRFTFDQVACETIDQDTLFRMAGLPMVENSLSGYNSCMFAYGQTGSGKTYTMLGGIEDLEVKPSLHRGMTPRIFEFLFARIQAEEESRRDEKLKYCCKCSFLEIYNEQVTDLLDPSSTNLLLREDVKKGVYVENLSEFEVQSVNDVLKLLMQGSSNRRVAATNMNRESSRSHSVFTCVIESRWEKDSTTNLRFARLNLVDLAGSERQKTSGAEGERLKEAANINKSLSTLGHVIMVLVDVANGKPRHVPYRDSRLTFLLQDSLGGNSKTMIIANVSPSICCAAETLNTLKFAQRAKLIQNNAVVNEDSTGDVVALQDQIRLLKEELSALKHQNVSRSLSFGSSVVRKTLQDQENAFPENIFEVDQQNVDDFLGAESKSIVRLSTKQLKSLETTLAGALRREQMAETSVKQIEAEIEQLNRLVRQREEDTRSTKMMLKFREDKIQKMESVLSGLIPAESYLVEENKRLSEENQMLRAKIDRNPEVTRFAMENIRLLDQLRRFQEFYEEGERDVLLSEVSNMRDQLLQYLDGNSKQIKHQGTIMQPQEATCISKEIDSLRHKLESTLSELEECRCRLDSCVRENAQLNREINDLHATLSKSKPKSCDHDGIIETNKDSLEASSSVPNRRLELNAQPILLKHAEEIMNLQLELDILKSILTEERSTRSKTEERAERLNRDLDMAKEKLFLTTKELEEANAELRETKSIMEALESQQIFAINEMEDLKINNSRYIELLNKQEREIASLKEQLSHQELRDHSSSNDSKSKRSPLQPKLDKMHESLEKAKRLNMWYQSYCAVEASNDEEIEKIRRQAEAETAEVIVCMQEELASLQQQVQDSHLKEIETQKNLMLTETELKELEEKLFTVSEDNKQLRENLEKKGAELETLSEEWESLTSELEEILANGHEVLSDVSDQLDLISGSFPQRRIWISDQVGQMIRIISEKDLIIQDLTRCLEDADNRRTEVESMLKSLKGAALAITEAHQQECNEKEIEISLLNSHLSAKSSSIAMLEERLKLAEDQIRKASACATVAFVIVNRLSEIKFDHLNAIKYKDMQISELNELSMEKDVLLNRQADIIIEAEKQIQSLTKELAESEESCDQLRSKVLEEDIYICVMEQKLEEMLEDDFQKTTEKLYELKTGVSTLRSCMSTNYQHDKNPGKNECSPHTFSNVSNEFWTGNEMNGQNKTNLRFVEDIRTGEQNYFKSNETRKNICDRDVTITLLKREIESGLESLQDVQAEMAKLQAEKEEIYLSEKQSQENIRCFSRQLLSLQKSMVHFEKQSAMKLEAFNHRVEVFEKIVQDTITSWCQTKEVKVNDAWVIADQKMAEASCVIAKFEEAQETVEEADIMIKGLMIANESLKVDAERLRAVADSIMKERDLLATEVQQLLSINDSKSRQIENLENQIESNFTETRELAIEYEEVIAQFQKTITEEFMPVISDFRHTSSLYLDSAKFVRSWLEKIWSEIISKDCVLSVLHLCHMGILLETVMGLNAENGLLQHGLCESNSVIAGLREHNSKSRNELEICRVLKGKLLADIKNTFDRISRNEEETGQLGMKLTDFEKKISNLQSQEEWMLDRCNLVGSQLTILMKDLDSSNSNVIETLLDHKKLMEDKEDELLVQEELFMIELYSKDVELLVYSSRLEEMILQKAAAEKQCSMHCLIFEKLKKELVLFQVHAEMTEQILVEEDFQLVLLRKEVEETEKARQNLLSELNQSKLAIEEMDTVNRTLGEDIQSLKNLASSNNMLKGELCEVKESNMQMLNWIQDLEAENEALKKDMKQKEIAIESSSAYVTLIDEQNKQLQQDICLVEASSGRVQNEISIRNAELSSCHEVLENLKEAFILCNADLRLKEDFLLDKEVEVSLLQNEIDEVQREREVLLSQIKQSGSKIKNMAVVNQALEQDMQLLKHAACTNSNLKEELAGALEANMKLLNQVQTLDTAYKKLLMDLEIKEKALNSSSSQISILDQQNQKLQQDIRTLEASACRLQNEIDMKDAELSRAICLEEENRKLQDQMSSFESQITSLQSELLRKDGVIKGLSFDLSLLQESAASTKDQKDEFKRLMASLQDLEDELEFKSNELKEAITQNQMLEAQLQEEKSTVSALELDILQQGDSIKTLRAENDQLRAQANGLFEGKESMGEELNEERKANESLEKELSQMGNVIDNMNETIDLLKNNMDELTSERNHLNMEIQKLKENLELVQAQAEENKVIASEAQQIAESRKAYAAEKEEEIKLLERSVEELECTVNVLENKVDLIKGEAERQRLQREELELELHSVKHQTQTIRTADADLKSLLNVKENNLQEALKQRKELEFDIAEKGAEIKKLKAHINELNLHAEAQASEYKQKFKELEAMLEQVRPDCPFTHIQNPSSNKAEKLPAKSRGSGSPFKCIGLGLVQQIKSDRDEELTAAKQRIEELESLAASRQKEIFAVKARLASAESMTHDVIRDLLGVKLDVTTYASLLDNQQMQRIAEKAQGHTLESQDQEIVKLQQQLSEFIRERKGWLNEIDREQAELVAAQVSLEQLNQQDQLLRTQNEMLKVENVNHKKKVVELEEEVKKLSGQQNLQQRIHHHAKIKEENNMLKLQNEELSAKLRRSDLMLASVKEELTRYCALKGKVPYMKSNEEQRLTAKLKEAEEERLQVAQKFLGLCTSILKAAGITRPASEINPSVAEEVLEQLKSKVTSLERELQGCKLKNRMNKERLRLAELKPESPPKSSRNENCGNVRKSTCLSALDR